MPPEFLADLTDQHATEWAKQPLTLAEIVRNLDYPKAVSAIRKLGHEREAARLIHHREMLRQAAEDRAKMLDRRGGAGNLMDTWPQD